MIARDRVCLLSKGPASRVIILLYDGISNFSSKESVWLLSLVGFRRNQRSPRC